jgi:N-acetylglucosamine-6-phosphate deacetylase
MSAIEALTGAGIFDGERWHRGAALILEGGEVAATVPADDIPPECDITVLDGGVLTAGFVDLQVNGGGGVLFNDRPDVEGIATLCAAHGRFGTTALLPTLITDTPEVMTRALEAGFEAGARKLPGFLGLHLEGPHLSFEKRGVHKPDLIRPMTETDEERLLAAKARLPFLMVTLAPESVSTAQIARLAGAGIIISIGHTNASFEQVNAAAAAGARSVTHLFNAMSPLTHREPGVVGAALHNGSLFCGMIADGIHVAPAAMDIAIAAKKRPGKVFLISDAMSTIGTSLTRFTLYGETIYRREGRLTLADGTLAGADLELNMALRTLCEQTGTALEEAVRMATLYPAACLRADAFIGHLKPGARASIVHLDEKLRVRRVWTG